MPYDELPLIMASSLALTLILEAAFALTMGVRGRAAMAVVLLVNVLTNPLAVLASYYIFERSDASMLACQILPELAAVAAEAFIYSRQRSLFKKPLLLAVGANAFSYGVGLIINGFI